MPAEVVDTQSRYEDAGPMLILVVSAPLQRPVRCHINAVQTKAHASLRCNTCCHMCWEPVE